MGSPKLSGIHHLKMPVSDIDEVAQWFEKTLNAKRISRFDHKNEKGVLYAAMMELPGLDQPIELRHAPGAARSVAGYDPVSYQADTKEDLDAWIKQLDSAGWPHSPVITGYIGHVLEFKTPDGLEIRIYTKPQGGFKNVNFDSSVADIHNPYVDNAFMKS